MPRLDTEGVAQRDLFLTEVEAVTGQYVLAEHFPAVSGSPVVVVAPAGQAEEVQAVVTGTNGIVNGRGVAAARESRF